MKDTIFAFRELTLVERTLEKVINHSNTEFIYHRYAGDA